MTSYAGPVPAPASRRRRPGGTPAARRRLPPAPSRTAPAPAPAASTEGLPTADLPTGAIPTTALPTGVTRGRAAGAGARAVAARAPGDTAGPAPIRWPLRVAAALTGLDGIALAAYGVLQLVLVVVRPRGTALVVAVLGGLLFVAFGIGLLLAARALWRGRRRGRAPAVVAHLVTLLLVPSLLAGGTWWLGVPLAVVAVTAGITLFLPSSVRSLRPAAPRDPRAPRAPRAPHR